MIFWLGVAVIVGVSVCASVHILLCNMLVQWLRLRRTTDEAVTNRDFLHWWYGRLRAYFQPLYSSAKDSRDLHEIDTNVFLGDFNAAANRGNLRELGITHVVTVIIGVPPMFGDDFTYKIVPIRDSPECNIHQYLTECCEFIQDALMQNGRVKIHCMKGVSRSATVAAAWLMWNHNWLVDAAISHLQSVRPVVNPNTGFRKQLEDWRAEFVAQRRERQGPSKPLSVEGLAIVSEGGGTALAAGLAMERGSALETRDVVVL